MSRWDSDKEASSEGSMARAKAGAGSGEVEVGDREPTQRIARAMEFTQSWGTVTGF